MCKNKYLSNSILYIINIFWNKGRSIFILLKVKVLIIYNVNQLFEIFLKGIYDYCFFFKL